VKIFDFNIHLADLTLGDIDSILLDEMSLAGDRLLNAFSGHYSNLQDLNGMNIMLFNTSLFSGGLPDDFMSCVKEKDNHIVSTALIDFRHKNLEEYLSNVVRSGVKAIKFHPYIQKISKDDYSLVYKACQIIEDSGLIICVDASYGSTGMYKYNNLDLVCFLSDLVKNTPIIILHSGGARCFDAMLIALEKNNVYLETSFSLPFYQGSSVEADLAFVYQKVGAERILYASDYPMIGTIVDSSTAMLNFLDKYKFPAGEIEKIMYGNAFSLCQL